jgi:hypothetical protein
MTKTSKKDGLWDYRAPAELDGVGRAVGFLLWAAKNFPRRPVPITHIVRVALSERSLPKEESKDVTNFRQNKMAVVRHRLEDKHNRGIVYHPGMGYRATVDEDDKLENVFERKRKRVQSSIAGFNRTESMIDRTGIKAEHNKERFDSLVEAGKRLNAPAILKRLAPPTEEEGS